MADKISENLNSTTALAVGEKIAKEDRENNPIITAPTAYTYFEDPRKARVIPEEPLYSLEERFGKTSTDKTQPETDSPLTTTTEETKTNTPRYAFGKGHLPVKVTGS